MSEEIAGVVPAASDALQGVQAAQARLKEVEEKYAAVKSVEEERNAKVRVVYESARTAQAEVERVAALHELTAEQQLAQENGRRSVRRLGDELADARKLAAEASAESGKAADAVAQAKRQVRVEQVNAADSDYLRDVQETVARLKEKRVEIFATLHELWADHPDEGNFNRGRISALASPYDPELVAAQWAFECLAAKIRQQADQKRLERN